MVNPVICRHLIISGRVQGVGYRKWTAAQANARGLSGWVRNRADGTVEAVLCGDEAAVQAMIVACRKGPMLARVDDIIISDSDEQHVGAFEQRETL